MSSVEWYFEYEIHQNRPGILGGISSLLGILDINILTINGVQHHRRGMLLKAKNQQKIDVLKKILLQMDEITITALRPPRLADRLAIRHGRYIERYDDEKKTYRFTRDEMGILVDFMGNLFSNKGHQLIGVRGMPRVGKTESIVASSVCANKRWVLLSSTLLRQTIRNQLLHNEMLSEQVYIIDGIVSSKRSTDDHKSLIREILQMDVTKVIEHPDAFVRMSDVSINDFDYIIELCNEPNEVIHYQEHETDFYE